MIELTAEEEAAIQPIMDAAGDVSSETIGEMERTLERLCLTAALAIVAARVQGQRHTSIREYEETLKRISIITEALEAP